MCPLPTTQHTLYYHSTQNTLPFYACCCSSPPPSLAFPGLISNASYSSTHSVHPCNQTSPGAVWGDSPSAATRSEGFSGQAPACGAAGSGSHRALPAATQSGLKRAAHLATLQWQHDCTWRNGDPRNQRQISQTLQKVSLQRYERMPRFLPSNPPSKHFTFSYLLNWLQSKVWNTPPPNLCFFPRPAVKGRDENPLPFEKSRSCFLTCKSGVLKACHQVQLIQTFKLFQHKCCIPRTYKAAL